MNCDHCIGLDNDDGRQVYLSNASLHHPDTYDLFKFCPDCGASLAAIKIPEYSPPKYDDSNASNVEKAFRSESERAMSLLIGKFRKGPSVLSLLLKAGKFDRDTKE